MNALVLVVLSQVVAPQPQQVAPQGERVTFFDGRHERALYVSATQVGEPLPTEAGRQRVLAADPSATVTLETRSMRVWSVRDAKALLAVKGLAPLLFSAPSTQGVFKVPLGLVCDGKDVAVPWREALAKSGAQGCLPNFWYPLRAL